MVPQSHLSCLPPRGPVLPNSWLNQLSLPSRFQEWAFVCLVGVVRLGSTEFSVSHGEGSGIGPFQDIRGLLLTFSMRPEPPTRPRAPCLHPPSPPSSLLPQHPVPYWNMEHQSPLSHLSCRLFPAASPNHLFNMPSFPTPLLCATAGCELLSCVCFRSSRPPIPTGS